MITPVKQIVPSDSVKPNQPSRLWRYFLGRRRYRGLLAALLVLPLTASADLVLHEAFDYPVDQILQESPPWSLGNLSGGGGVDITFEQGSLSIAGLAGGTGNRVQIAQPNDVNALSSADRPIPEVALNINGEEFWLSFIIRVEDMGTHTFQDLLSFGKSNGYATVRLNNGNQSGNFRMSILKGSTSGGGVTFTNDLPLNTDHFVVLRLVRNNLSSQTLSMWVNPAPASFGNGSVPTGATAIHNSDGGSTLVFDWLRLVSTWRANSVYVDEIRAGRTWAAVSPPAPIPVSPALALEKGEAILASGNSVDFGVVPIGETGVSETFTIRNNGSGDLNISAIGISSDGAPSSQFLLDDLAMLLTVPPGGSTAFAVSFAPAHLGEASGELTVQSDDPETPDFTLHFTGRDLYGEWALSHGLTGEDALPGADSDGDGFTNEEEWLAGTDPGDIASFPADPATRFTHTGSMAIGRSGHTATLLPNGKVLVAGGGSNSAEIYDPDTGAWSGTGSMVTARSNHTATLLPNGKVLVAGGAATTTAEIYDPATGIWSSGGGLIGARSYHTAVLLPNGKVLVAGGWVADTSLLGITLTTAELYDPETDTWTGTGNLVEARQQHTATLLPDGKLLVAGGFRITTFIPSNRSSTEIYDPDTGTWSLAANFGQNHSDHTATLLPDGRVLVAGSRFFGGSSSSIAKIYDPATNDWSATGNLVVARGAHTATLLPSGKVLVTGGSESNTVELYDPAAGEWSAFGSMAFARSNHTATLLADGRVLLVGGGGAGANTAELFEPAVPAWETTGNLVTARRFHTATLLLDGKVLAAGGNNSGGALASTELYDPATDLWHASGNLSVAREAFTATLLPDGQVLAAGGVNASGVSLATTELYDPAAGTWSPTGNLGTTRNGHTATLLPDGKILVAGGRSTIVYLATAELYDPETGIWSATGDLATARNGHTATLLPDGKVLVAGGFQFNGTSLYLASAELYDPVTGTWSPTGDLENARHNHTATLLPDGRVLIAGGFQFNESVVYLGSVELYDPVTGTWSATGHLASPRQLHTATLLPGGKVLVAGGNNSGGFNTRVELYDPATGTWSPSPDLASGPLRHTATLLPSGNVLIAGGSNSGNILSSAERYDAGLGFSQAWRPRITTASFDTTGRLILTGSGFRGISGATGGNGSQNSSTNYPLAKVRRLDNGHSVFLLPDANERFSDTEFTSVPITISPGPALVTVFTNGIPSEAIALITPGIANIIVEEPVGSALTSGDVRDFGVIFMGLDPVMVFAIRNTGNVMLTVADITLEGGDAGEFDVVVSPAAEVAPGVTTTFTVQFAPRNSGVKTALLRIASNDPDDGPFDITLTGRSLSFAEDSDGDGLNDAAEFQLAALGFDWEVSQPELVNILFDHANGAGLYHQAQYDGSLNTGIDTVLNAPNAYGLYSLLQIQALHVGTPLLARDSEGRFTLTITVKKSTDLVNFDPFPMDAPGTSATLNEQGDLEFLFTVPDEAAFFRLESRGHE